MKVFVTFLSVIGVAYCGGGGSFSGSNAIASASANTASIGGGGHLGGGENSIGVVSSIKLIK